MALLNAELAVCACPLAFQSFPQCQIDNLHAPARIWLFCSLLNCPFARARSRFRRFLNVKLAVCTRPLVFCCLAHCQIGRLRMPARVSVVSSMSNWQFACARSYSVALLIVTLPVCVCYFTASVNYLPPNKIARGDTSTW